MNFYNCYKRKGVRIMKPETKAAGLAWITFLTSTSTLICCTLPILFVALGFGASLASMTTQFHWWITFSEYKFWLFLMSGILILFSFWTLKRQGRFCPTDPVLAKKCLRLQRFNMIV